MEEMSPFQKLERQVENEAKRWKEERMKELIDQNFGDQAEVSPPERTPVDQTEKDDH